MFVKREFVCSDKMLIMPAIYHKNTRANSKCLVKSRPIILKKMHQWYPFVCDSTYDKPCKQKEIERIFSIKDDGDNHKLNECKKEMYELLWNMHQQNSNSILNNTQWSHIRIILSRCLHTATSLHRSNTHHINFRRKSPFWQNYQNKNENRLRIKRF